MAHFITYFYIADQLSEWILNMQWPWKLENQYKLNWHFNWIRFMQYSRKNSKWCWSKLKSLAIKCRKSSFRDRGKNEYFPQRGFRKLYLNHHSGYFRWFSSEKCCVIEHFMNVVTKYIENVQFKNIYIEASCTCHNGFSMLKHSTVSAI